MPIASHSIERWSKPTKNFFDVKISEFVGRHTKDRITKDQDDEPKLKKVRLMKNMLHEHTTQIVHKPEIWNFKSWNLIRNCFQKLELVTFLILSSEQFGLCVIRSNILSRIRRRKIFSWQYTNWLSLRHQTSLYIFFSPFFQMLFFLFFGLFIFFLLTSVLVLFWFSKVSS